MKNEKLNDKETKVLNLIKEEVMSSKSVELALGSELPLAECATILQGLEKKGVAKKTMVGKLTCYEAVNEQVDEEVAKDEAAKKFKITKKDATALNTEWQTAFDKEPETKPFIEWLQEAKEKSEDEAKAIADAINAKPATSKAKPKQKFKAGLLVTDGKKRLEVTGFKDGEYTCKVLKAIKTEYDDETGKVTIKETGKEGEGKFKEDELTKVAYNDRVPMPENIASDFAEKDYVKFALNSDQKKTGEKNWHGYGIVDQYMISANQLKPYVAILDVNGKLHWRVKKFVVKVSKPTYEKKIAKAKK